MSIQTFQFITLVVLNLVTIGLGIAAFSQRDRQYRLARKQFKHAVKKQKKAKKKN